MLIETQIDVVNKLGLHARAAAKLVNTASSFTSDVWIEYNGQSVNAKSIMGLMMLAAACGSTVALRVEGEDAEEAARVIRDLFSSRFDEDE
jgi:phosphotransferase system HPr (HPr) family protein